MCLSVTAKIKGTHRGTSPVYLVVFNTVISVSLLYWLCMDSDVGLVAEP